MWISYVLGQAVSFFFTLFRMIPLAWNNHFSRRRFPREGDVVISLTSHGDRLDRVHYTLESIARGTVKAPVVLWLDGEDYRGEWPKTLRRLVAFAEAAYGPLRTLHDHALSDVVTVLGAINLFLGYVSGVALGCVAVAGRGRRRLAAWALLMPVYWLLISLAAYRALFQLVSAPYKWEQTQHRPRAAFSHPDT